MLPVGARLGPYEVVGFIGAGGMGEVYRARDTRLGREVALKVLPSEVALDSDRRSRFEQEARSASALNHPNIVTVHDIGTSDSTVYIAMELVEGRTVRELLAAGPLTIKKLLLIAGQAADGLARAHAAGIVHRDLKPENLMVTGDGFVKILDFGLAKLVAPVSQEGSELPTMAGAPGTHPGVVLGTVGYMSPEQASGQTVDFRSDQFSFGAILYEMATGKRAFQKGTAVETLSAIIRDDPEPITASNPAAPAPLRWIVETCLAKDPEERYASTRDLARDLKQAQTHLSELSGEAAPSSARRRGRRLWPVFGAAVLALLVAGLWLRGRPAASRPGSQASLTKVTFAPGLEDEPAWSPDGKFLAYTTDERGNLDVVVQPIAGGEALKIAANEADEAQPAWSPDGSRLAFVSARDHGGRLATILGQGPLTPFMRGRGGDIFVAPALGGSSAKLVEDGYSPAWSPDGKKIAYRAYRDGSWDLWVIPAEGGTPERLTRDTAFDYQPAWSPDGKLIAFGSGDNPNFNLRIVPAAGGPERELTKETHWVFRPAWTPDGSAIVYSAERNGIVNLWRVPFTSSGDSAEPERVTAGGGQDINASASQDGKRIAFSTVGGTADIWEWSIGPRTLRQVTSETSLEDYPRLSPDGKSLLASSDRTGQIAVWSFGLDGRSLTMLTTGAQEAQAQWSPDGQQVIFQRDRNLWIQPVGGVAARDLGIKGSNGTWSRDGTRLAFSCPRKSSFEICVVPVGGGPVRTLTSMQSDAGSPSWSPDGRQIAFQAAGGVDRHLWVVPAAAGTPRQITNGAFEESHPEWSPLDPDQILFLRNHRQLMTVSLASGKESPIDLTPVGRSAALPMARVVLDYPSWAPDGSRIYFSATRRTGDIYILGGD